MHPVVHHTCWDRTCFALHTVVAAEVAGTRPFVVDTVVAVACAVDPRCRSLAVHPFAVAL